MKHTMKRVLALIIALMLAVPGIAFSEELRVDEVVIDADAALEDVVLDEEISAEDVDLPVGEDGEASLYDLTDIDPDAQLTDDEPEAPAPVAFDQTVTVGDVEVAVMADAGAIPAGARLSVTEVDAHIAQAAMQSIEAMLGSAVTHHLYSIAVLDAGGNPLALNADMALPLVCVKGLPLDGDVRAFVYDPALDGSYEIDMEGEGQFRFQESATYDIVEAGYPDAEEEPVEQELSTVEQELSTVEQPVDQEQPADEQEQPADEQEQPADEQEQPDDEQGEQSEDAQGEQPVDEQPVGLVTVIFDTTPETAVITVKSEDEVILPGEDGSYLLSAGEYTYTAEADGYVSVENEPFTVSDETASDATVISDDTVSSNDHTASNEPMVITVVLEAVEEEPVAFDQSMTVDGVVVTVKADPGVFPADAVLSVEQVPVYMQRQADAAIEDVRDEDANVAVSYTFDIKVIDPETGEEIQPAEGQSVSVSFSLAEVAEENLETQVYHVTEDAGELSAEALDVTTLETGEDSTAVGNTAVVETDGFSIYTIEFTYKELQYVLPGYSSVAMEEILTAVGLTGEVTAVEISDTTLFSASNETGEWVVYAHQAFSSTEWMKVTINRVVYEIVVTDDQDDQDEIKVIFNANDGVFYDENGHEEDEREGYWMPGAEIRMEDWMRPQRENYKDGQVFLGYAKNSNATEADIVLDDGKEYKIPEDANDTITLYAVWGAGLQVIFDANGGAFYNDQGRKEGTQRDGYWKQGWDIWMDGWMQPQPGDMEGQVFLGYAESKDANAPIVLDWGEEGKYRIPENANDPVMLYAVWGDGLQVIFDANGGAFYDDGRKDGTQRDGYWRYASDIRMDDWMEPEPSVEGQVFLGYALTSNAKEAEIVLHWGEDGEYKIPENVTASFTLYAVWGDGLQVIFDANGGAFYDDEGRRDGTHRHGYWRQGWKFRMEHWMEPRAGKEDEVFLGYAEKPDASEKDIVLRWGEDGEYTIPEIADKPITLYAVWDKGLKVTFDANSGAFYDDEGRKDGTQRHGYWRHGWGIEMDDWMEPEPSVEGQVFLGYALKQDAKEEEVVLSWVKEYKIPEDATASFTLYAVWGDGLQVVFDANGGAFYDDEGRKDGNQRIDYKRRGWNIWLDDWMEPHAGEEDQVFLGYALTDNAEEEDIVLSWGEEGKYTIPMDAPNPVKLYAVWDKGLKVTFYANGGAFYDDDGREDGTQRDGYWMPGWDIRMEDWMCPDSEVEGKVFLGYAKNSNATEADIVFDWGREYKIPEDANDTITLYAVWDDGLKVTFDANGGAFYDDGRKDGTQRHGYWRHGWEIEMNGWMEPEHEEDGKVFLGYALTSDASEDDIVLHWGDDGKYEIPENATASFTLYAVWDKGVQVIFDANGGAFRDNEGNWNGTKRDGYWMPGWYVEMGNWLRPDHREDEDGDSVTRDGCWMPGSSIEMDDWMRPDPNEATEGKVFLGYALEQNANATIVLEWGWNYDIPEKAEGTITMYAVWGEGRKVIFDPNGGTFYDEEGNVDENQRGGHWMPGQRIQMDEWWVPRAAVEGKVFLGYALSKNAAASIVLDGGREYEIPENAGNTTTLYAVWDEWGEPTYTWSEDNSRVTAQRAFKNHASIKDKKTIGTTSAVTTPATCTAKGKMTYTAKFDNYDSFSDQTKTVENIDALGHNWGEWVKVADATTSAPEQQRRTCTRCNTVETRSVGDKLPSAPATVAPAAPAAPATPAAPAESVTIPKAPASVKAKAAKKGKVTVSWKKIKKTKKTKALLAQIKGIEVQYSTDPGFTNDVVTKPVGKNKTKLVLKLQKNTTYYVRVRYIDGAGGVSAWSGVKRVKTKKK